MKDHLTQKLLLTPWCRIFFEKVIVTQLVKHGTRKFITVFTKAGNLILS